MRAADAPPVAAAVAAGAARGAPAKTRFSACAQALGESATHGAKSIVDALNRDRAPADRVVDLSIGTLDEPTDARVHESVATFARDMPDVAHAFAPVRGFASVRQALSAKIARDHGVAFDADREILITPGGIKGALTVAFHTFLDPGDEVLVPIPNWPHYRDMIALHGAVMRPVRPSADWRSGLTAEDLELHLTQRTRMLVLGDCINPTGKVYATAELHALAAAIARHNMRAARAGRPGIEVLFDCPYEAHVHVPRAEHLVAIEVRAAGGTRYAMRDCTALLSGPGKTYGMHGDRLGYLCATPGVIDVAARVQANTNSFASTYAQWAAQRAFGADMDEVAVQRGRAARQTLLAVARRLRAVDDLSFEIPDGGYFLFVDCSAYAARYARRGHDSAASFLLAEARVATIDGRQFTDGEPGMEHFVRINCGRAAAVLDVACTRIEHAIAALSLR